MTMTLPKPVSKDCFSEADAAKTLGITIARLHQILDQFVFNEGTRRPANIEFAASDLLLLAYWSRESRNSSEPKPPGNVISIDQHK